MNKGAERFEQMLAAGTDNALLRFGLGNAYLEESPERARIHLERAVELDPDYSAAWKLLGKACIGSGDPDAAMRAFERGIAVAEGRGDVQAAKEMKVFLKRLSR